jgi:hypothetical protein
VRWYELDEATKEENERRLKVDARKRDAQVANSRLDLLERQKRLAEVYGSDSLRRARQAQERAVELERNEEVKLQINVNNVRAQAVRDEQKSLYRNDRRERMFNKLQEKEMGRLVEILDADKEGRDADRLATKLQKSKMVYKLSDVREYF